MIRLASFALALVSLVLAACSPGDVPDVTGDQWCYRYDLLGDSAPVNSDNDTINILRGEWRADGLGIRTVNNELSVSFIEPFFIHPLGVLVTVYQPTITEDNQTLLSGSVFGDDISLSQTIPTSFSESELVLWIANDSSDLVDGNSVVMTAQTTQPLQIRGLEVRGEGPNPYPRNDCGAKTPTPPPTETPVTGTPTPTPAPVHPDCPVNSTWSRYHTPNDSNELLINNTYSVYTNDGTYFLGRYGKYSHPIDAKYLYLLFHVKRGLYIKVYYDFIPTYLSQPWLSPRIQTPQDIVYINAGIATGYNQTLSYTFPSEFTNTIVFRMEGSDYRDGSSVVRVSGILMCGTGASPYTDATPVPTPMPTQVVSPVCAGTAQVTERSVVLGNPWNESSIQGVINGLVSPPSVYTLTNYQFRGVDTDNQHKLVLEYDLGTTYKLTRLVALGEYLQGHNVDYDTDFPRVGVKDAGNVATYGAYNSYSVDFDNLTQARKLLFNAVSDRGTTAPDGSIKVTGWVLCIRDSIPSTPQPTNTQPPSPTRTPLGIVTWTPSPTNIVYATSTRPPPTLTFTPRATPSPAPTWTPVTPQPTTTPPPTQTPRPTNTPIVLPTQPVTGTPGVEGTPIPGPGFTPIPGTAVVGTPQFNATPNATYASTAEFESTLLPTLDAGREWHDDINSNLGTAVGYLNEMPKDWGQYVPDTSGVGTFAGYTKYVFSGVILQEIFGVTLYPIAQHGVFFLGVVVVLTTSKVIWRLVLLFVKIAAWILRKLLKLVPFLG